MRLAILVGIAILLQALALADENQYLMNFHLNMLSPDGEVASSIQMQGISLVPDRPFHGNDFGEFDYFLTVSKLVDGKGTLTIEFYQFESRKKTSDVVSEIIAEVDFTFSSPTRFEGTNDTFGVDLAFSIDQARMIP